MILRSLKIKATSQKRTLFERFIVIAVISLTITSCSIQREAFTTSNNIVQEEIVNINGVNQAIVIRGQNTNNPVLVFVHGGPGYPLFPYIDNFKAIEKEFTVLYWEQRGTAKSLSRKVKKDMMCTDTLLSDLSEVVKFAQIKLKQEKVFLWGHSWGSNLGMLYTNKHPENLYAYIGTGQSVDLFTNEKLCYQYALSSSVNDQNKKAIKELSKIDTTNYQLKDALKVRKWIYTYGGIVHKVNTEKAYVNFDVVKDVFKTPEYAMNDKWRLLMRSKYSGKNLWDDMMVLNLFDQITEVKAPVYFFLGRYDHLVSSTLAERYFNTLQSNTTKQIIWFKESAHRPQNEQADKFLSELIKVKNQHYFK